MEGLELDCSAAVKEDLLVIAYRITNATDRDVALLDRLSEGDVDGGRRYDLDFCYVDIEVNTLHVAQMMLPIPKELSVMVKLVPKATLLGRHSTLKREIALDIPVEARNPYIKSLLDARSPRGTPQVIAISPGSADVLVLSIGCVPLVGEAHLEPLSPAHPEVLRLMPPAASSGQIVLERELRLASSVATLDYDAPRAPGPSAP
jgi:hypothetical protein